MVTASHNPMDYNGMKLVREGARPISGDSGLFARLLTALQAAADARGEVDWNLHLVDSTIIRAHQHAAGTKGGKRQSASGAAEAGSAPSCT